MSIKKSNRRGLYLQATLLPKNLAKVSCLDLSEVRLRLKNIGIHEGSILKVVGYDSSGELCLVQVDGAMIALEKGKGGVAEMVLYHHERWDGSGYPKGT